MSAKESLYVAKAPAGITWMRYQGQQHTPSFATFYIKTKDCNQLPNTTAPHLAASTSRMTISQQLRMAFAVRPWPAFFCSSRLGVFCCLLLCPLRPSGDDGNHRLLFGGWMPVCFSLLPIRLIMADNRMAMTRLCIGRLWYGTERRSWCSACTLHMGLACLH